MALLRTIGAAAATLAIASIILRLIQCRIVSPLRKVPGPFIASVTGQWLALIDMAGHRSTTIHRLHEKYGSVVRIGPNEVSFSDASVVKEIYSQQTVYRKADVYLSLSIPPLGIFSMTDKAVHSKRRNLLSYAFSQKFLYDCEPLVHAHAATLVDLAGDSAGKPWDVFVQFRLFALDVVGELFLGSPLNAMGSEKPPAFLDDLQSHFILSGIDYSFPWLSALLPYLPISKLHWMLGSRDRIVEYGKAAYTTYIDRYGRDSGRKDLLTKILSPKTDETPMTDAETHVEIGNMLSAGMDTTSLTLTYLFWELTQHPIWQTHIRAELAELDLTPGALPSFKELTDLPVLEAVINESLRLHPAAPASLQRTTPAGGAVLDGYYMPENTTVSMQCYTTHRNPTAFPSPETFDPARWLPSSHPLSSTTNEGPTPESKTLFMPFSRGARACLGMNLAMMELRLATAALVRDFTVSAAEGTTAESMEMVDHFLAAPKGGKCELVFGAVGAE